MIDGALIFLKKNVIFEPQVSERNLHYNQCDSVHTQSNSVVIYVLLQGVVFLVSFERKAMASMLVEMSHTRSKSNNYASISFGSLPLILVESPEDVGSMKG